jgi:hypothetical protein
MQAVHRPFIIVHRPMPASARWVLALVAASLVAIAAAAGWRAHREPPPELWPSIDNFATLLFDPMGAGLPRDLTPAWTSSAERSLPAEARAVRIGALVADLRAVSWARNAVAPQDYYQHDPLARRYAVHQCSVAVPIAHQLAAHLDRIPGGADGAKLIRSTEDQARRGATITWGEQWHAINYALTWRPSYVLLGNWLEATRIAALRGDRDFFRRPEVKDEALNAAALDAVPPHARIALTRLRTLVVVESEPDFERISGAATTALEALAN